MALVPASERFVDCVLVRPAKGLFAIGRSWGHEPCWVVRRAGARVKFLGPRDQSTAWRVASPKMNHGWL